MDLTGLLEVAVRAARAAGKIQREWLGREKRVEFKGEINLVTEVDRRCEGKIIEIIRGRSLDIYGQEILTTNGKIHNEMMKVLQKG